MTLLDARIVIACVLASCVAACDVNVTLAREDGRAGDDARPDDAHDEDDRSSNRDGESHDDEPTAVDAPVDAAPATPSAGTGNGVLEVNAEVSATENAPNAQRPSSFGTSMIVSVLRRGAPVTGASVTISWPGGRATLMPTSAAGQYTSTQAGYDQTYTLDVAANGDRVEAVRVVGPAIHWFTMPTVGLRQSAGQPINVMWTSTGAQAALISTRNLSETMVPDTGSFVVAGSYIRVDGGASDTEDRIRLRRQNRIVPAGAAAGSEFSVGVRNEVEFVVASGM